MSAAQGASAPASDISSNAIDHFEVLAALNHGQKHFECKYCQHQFKGTASRCYVHLTGEGTGVSPCTLVPEEVLQKLKARKATKDAERSAKRKAKEDAEERRRRRESTSSAAPPLASSSRGSRGPAQGEIQKAFARANNSKAHMALADLLFFEGLPLRVVNSKWLRRFITAVREVPNYSPPAYNTLRTTLLDDAVKRVNERLGPRNSRLPITGTTVCADGWSDAANRPLLNILAVNPKGPKFLTAINTSGEVKSAEYIAAKCIESIEAVGADHVVQVITDNAQACKAAGLIIEGVYPHITWSPCVAHVCDLALEDIFDLGYFKDLHSNTKGFVFFITNHHHTLAAWRQHQANNPSSSGGSSSILQLLKPGETRFASALLMIERTIKVKSRLQQFVVSDSWQDAISTMKASDKAAAGKHKDIILSSSHWALAEAAFDVCEPILKLLRTADGDTPSSGKVHYYAHKVQQHLAQDRENIDDEVMEEVREIWKQRRQQMDSPVFGAAYCLDPEFWGDSGLAFSNQSDACVSDLRKMIRKLLPADEQQAARLSYASFHAREGVFGEQEALEDAAVMPAHQWWENYGGGHPELQKIAVKLLSQVSSACSCERNWSSYDFIHNRRRNRLTAARARDLVFVFTNGRLADKMTDNEEAFVGWDEEEEMEAEGDADETTDVVVYMHLIITYDKT